MPGTCADSLPEKARWIAGQVDPETLVIGADTVVVRDGEILGKPKGEEEARAMLASCPGAPTRFAPGSRSAGGTRSSPRWRRPR